MILGEFLAGTCNLQGEVTNSPCKFVGLSSWCRGKGPSSRHLSSFHQSAVSSPLQRNRGDCLVKRSLISTVWQHPPFFSSTVEAWWLQPATSGEECSRRGGAERRLGRDARGGGGVSDSGEGGALEGRCSGRGAPEGRCSGVRLRAAGRRTETRGGCHAPGARTTAGRQQIDFAVGFLAVV